MPDIRFFIMIQIYLAFGVCIVTTFFNYSFNVFSANLSYKIRMKYFERCLEMDAAWYDENNATQMPSKIANESAKIKNGLGIKVGQLIQSICQFFAGFIIAFIQGWHFTLILFGFTPLIICTFGCMMASIIGGIREIQKTYAQSAGYAEQAFQAIKVV